MFKKITKKSNPIRKYILKSGLVLLIIIGVISVFFGGKFTEKVTSMATTKIVGYHTCDPTSPFCLDALDLLPSPNEISTREIFKIEDKKLKSAYKNAKKRSEKLIGKPFSSSDVSIRSVSDSEKGHFFDAVVSIDYYNYEKKYGINPLKNLLSTRSTSDVGVTFNWDDGDFIEAGLSPSKLARYKDLTSCIYKHYKEINGNPWSSSNNRVITIKPLIYDDDGNSPCGDFILNGCYSYIYGKESISLLIYDSSDFTDVARTLSHEISHAWRGPISGIVDDQVEEGLAKFNSREFMKWASTKPSSDKCFIGIDTFSYFNGFDSGAYLSSFDHFDYHYLIYSTLYDGPSSDYADTFSYVKNYIAGYTLIAKLYLVNNNFLRNFHKNLEGLYSVMNNKETKDILIKSVGKDKIIDMEYAPYFINNLPLLRKTATPGRYLELCSYCNPFTSLSFNLIEKDKYGTVYPISFTNRKVTTGKFYNSFSWPNNIRVSSNLGLSLIEDIKLKTRPSSLYNYGRFKYSFNYNNKVYTSDYFFGFSKALDGSSSPELMNSNNVFFINPGIAHPNNYRYLMGITDTTGDNKPKKVSFYCNEKYIETKNMIFNQPKTSTTFSNKGCIGNAAVSVKVNELSGDSSKYYSRLTIDGGHVFNFDSFDSKWWNEVSPISNIRKSKVTGEPWKITFFTSRVTSADLMCDIGIGFSTPVKVRTGYLNRRGDWFFTVDRSFQRCWFETKRRTYDGYEISKSKVFSLL